MSIQEMYEDLFIPEYISDVATMLREFDIEGLKKSKGRWRPTETGINFYSLPEVVYS